jgi:hypothetical protein
MELTIVLVCCVSPLPIEATEAGRALLDLMDSYRLLISLGFKPDLKTSSVAYRRMAQARSVLMDSARAIDSVSVPN